MIFFYHKTSERDPFTSISQPVPGCWIHIDEAKQEDLVRICGLAEISPLLLYDALDRYELPRIELLDDCLLFFTRHPISENKLLYTSTLTIVLTKNYFITISPIKSFLPHHMLDRKGIATSLSSSDWMRDILLWITQEFNLFIRKTRQRVLSQERDLGSVTSEDIYALTQYEETLNQYLASLDSFSLALAKLLYVKSSEVYVQKEEIIEDVFNNLKQAESLCEIMIKNIRSLRDAYQIIFANSLTRTIKLLTALTIIFTVPNIVASIYGMNVHLPLSNNSHAFSILMAVMIFLSGLCGYWFYRKKLM